MSFSVLTSNQQMWGEKTINLKNTQFIDSRIFKLQTVCNGSYGF